ncbi:MAG TPA: hypothetical protein VEO19_15280 [Terriglobia bacterium]|nr:hypothetical protein [Terriglobia bacterium]
MARHLGKMLNEPYGRGAILARYREDGVRYHLIEVFPADLYDAHGVIRFESDAQYRRYIRIGPERNSTHADIVGRGIASIPGYEKLNPPPHTLV